jgi:hypothetical protein
MIQCPRCGLINPSSPAQCDCGHLFAPADETRSPVRGPLAGTVRLAHQNRIDWMGFACDALTGVAGAVIVYVLAFSGQALFRIDAFDFFAPWFAYAGLIFFVAGLVRFDSTLNIWLQAVRVNALSMGLIPPLIVVSIPATAAGVYVRRRWRAERRANQP